MEGTEVQVGGVAGGAKPSIWDDPNLLAIMLGMGGQAAMGQYGQQSWQAQLGKGAMGLGQSFKMAGIMEAREKERSEEREYWRKLVEEMSGLKRPEEAATMSLKELGFPEGMG